MKLIKDEILNKLLDKNETIVLAVSTGIDSMSLFHYLYNLGYKIVVAHVNHKKRVESDTEYAYLEKYCNDNNIPFEGYVLNSIDCGNFQEKARSERYDFLKRVADKYNTKTIVTAHQENDLVETIIMRLSRGSFLRGYMGISDMYYLSSYKIVRPLLYTKRSQIETYQKECGFKFFSDSSNEEDHYTRNKIRHHVLPVLENINNNYCDAFMNYSVDIKDVYNLVDRLSESFLNNKAIIRENEVSFDINDYKELDDIIKKEVVLKSVNIVSNNTLELTHEKLKKIAEFSNIQNESKEIELGDDISLFIEYSRYVFVKKTNSLKVDLVIDEFGTYSIGNGKEIVVSKESVDLKSKTSYMLCYNNKDVIFPIYVRNIKDGDKITVSGITKTIKQILKDNKIPKRTRNDYLIFSNNDGAFFVPYIIRKETDTTKENKLFITLREVQNEN